MFGTDVKHLQLCDKENKQEGKINSSTKKSEKSSTEK
jgi:hypothetical protein